MSALRISNRDARRLWLDAQGLSAPPNGSAAPDELMQIIKDIGFVQLDTIRIVARAHDHIMWSRRQAYREGMLDELVKDRTAFEHFTHDASILPMETYPYWTRQFARMEIQLKKARWQKAMPSKKECAAILERVASEGPLSTRDFEAAPKKTKHEWARPPHKFALDYYWHTGVLATCHRKNFIKHYNLRENVIPKKFRQREVSDAKQLDWLCSNALDRLSFGTEGDIQRFWDAADNGEVKAWAQKKRKKLVEVEITCADKDMWAGLAFADIEQRLENVPAPTSRLRILSPFDPAVRDRTRLQRLFGFDYRIEIFVPAAKRQYGYYVYPILEGDRFVGRIEARADRKKGTLSVDNLWWEKGVKETNARRAKLEAELDRMARFAGLQEVVER